MKHTWENRISGSDVDQLRPIFVIGYPSHVGGADTELWHTLKIWRMNNVPVRIIPTWHANTEWKHRLEAIGIETIEIGSSNNLSNVHGIRGATVVSFCNGEFLNSASILRKLDCRIVWLNCMTWLFEKELEHYRDHGGFDAYVFQSAFQRDCLFPRLQSYGVKEDQCFQIRGAFSPDEFEFKPLPHRKNEPFVYGRIARPDLDKWSSNFWPIYNSIQYSRKYARVMAWSSQLTGKCGAPPDWADALAANAEPAQSFLTSLHCMFPINGGAQENWPRSGLEAMASGVPIVAQNLWGWKEMIEHGVTGFLGDDDCELAHYAAVLAHDPQLRMEIAFQARKRLTEELANSEVIFAQWQTLFQDLSLQSN